MPQVSVSINGKTYRMACDEGEQQRLIGLAEKFETYVETLKSSFGEIGDQRLTVMAAIMVVDEMTEAKRQIRALQAELASLRDSRNAVIERYEADTQKLAGRLDGAAERIGKLAELLVSVDLEDAQGVATGE